VHLEAPLDDAKQASRLVASLEHALRRLQTHQLAALQDLILERARSVGEPAAPAHDQFDTLPVEFIHDCSSTNIWPWCPEIYWISVIASALGTARARRTAVQELLRAVRARSSRS
jgi:hypothetical protein